MNQTIDFNILDKKVIVVVHVRSNPGTNICKIFFREGKFSDIVRKMVRRSLPSTRGHFNLRGCVIKSELTDTCRIPLVALQVSWETTPLWWSNHPEWYKAPFCGEEVPEEGWFIRKSIVKDVWEISDKTYMV